MHRNIEKLSPEVVNRIAAGEVVQRPSAALKELMENSLDAGATTITVRAQNGGLDVLQVSDDGSGIQHVDLPLLCERYATSKLRAFEDLQTIASFGFRGEALSSISYVSRVTVTTKPRPASSTGSSSSGSSAVAAPDVAWRCRYHDSELLGEPQPCAGNYGTTIRAESLFYNSHVRRQALKPTEEWSKIVDVVSKYALAFPRVAFSCQREDASATSNNAALSFPKDSNTLQNIRIAYGNTIASHLTLIYHFDGDGASEGEGAGEGEGEPRPRQPSSQDAALMAEIEAAGQRVQGLRGKDGEGRFTIVGYTSDSTLSQKKSHLCLFVNNRLVESSAFRKAIDVVYSSVLTGGNKPFTVLLLHVPPDRVDVNIHPTKQEVYLLDEDRVLSRVSQLIRAALLQAASERQVDILSLRNTATVALKSDILANKALTQQQQQPKSSSTAVMEAMIKRESSGSFVSQGGGGGGGGGQGGKITVAPCTMVRVEQQKGALDVLFRSKSDKALQATTRAAEPPSSISTASAETTTPNPTGSGDGDGDADEAKRTYDLETVLKSIPTHSGSGGGRAATSHSPPSSPVTGTKRSSATAFVATMANGDDEDDKEEDNDDVMLDFKRYKAEKQSAEAKLAAAASDATRSGEAEVGEVPPCETAAPRLSDAGLLGAVEVEYHVLSSIEMIAKRIECLSSQTARSFADQLSYVGVLDSRTFLGQVGTTLYVLDTLQWAREAVYQRIFLRWMSPSLAHPPTLQFDEPPRVEELLRTALCRHGARLTPATEALSALRDQCGGSAALLADPATLEARPPVRLYLRRLVRRLMMWREMLAEYFSIHLSEDARLVALPYGLQGTHWPPVLCMLPVFLWHLAECVPYPALTLPSADGDDPEAGVREEADCFTAIAHHMADDLYGFAPHPEWEPKEKEEEGEAENAGGEAAAGRASVPTRAAGVDAREEEEEARNASSGRQSKGSVPSLEDALRFGLLPCFKQKRLFFAPSSFLTDGSVQSMVSVEALYKVFERC